MNTTWLPPHVARVHEAVIAEASRLAQAKSQLGENGPNLNAVDTIGSINRAIELLTDDRSMTTAYLHAVASPRPNMTAIAKAQNVSPSTLRHRYTSEQTEATIQLARGLTRFDTILAPFASFEDHHLLHAGRDDTYSTTWAQRENLRLAFFRFADRMESPNRDYSDNRIHALCYQCGWAYEKSCSFVNANPENETLIQLTIESSRLQCRNGKAPEAGHSGVRRRLISEYPMGMMSEALKKEARDLRTFYADQLL